MTRFRLWVAKKIHKHIEWHKEQVKYYEGKLQNHLNCLSTEDFFVFAYETGYSEKKFNKRLNNIKLPSGRKGRLV